MPLALVNLLGIVFAALFGPDVLKKWGLNLGAPDNSTQASAFHYQPAATGTTSGAQAVAKPTAGQFAQTLAENPASMWGFGLVCFGGIFLFAQARAAAHEAGTAAVATYSEATKVGKAAAAADSTTGNLSRFAK